MVGGGIAPLLRKIHSPYSWVLVDPQSLPRGGRGEENPLPMIGNGLPVCGFSGYVIVGVLTELCNSRRTD